MMDRSRWACATVFLALAAEARAQGTLHPPYNLAAQTDPGDPSILTLTWNDGWFDGFAGPGALNQTAIRISTTSWGADPEFWFDNTATDVIGVIPSPVAPPTGFAQQTTISGL